MIACRSFAVRWLVLFVSLIPLFCAIVAFGCGNGSSPILTGQATTSSPSTAPVVSAPTAEIANAPQDSATAVEVTSQPASERSDQQNVSQQADPLADPNAPVELAQVRGDANPFPRQIPIPDFPAELQWLNVDKPLTKADLKGKFVLLDFWTYCCINCMHILPELKKLEQTFPKQLVVIGVHSAKFETEKSSKNIEEAILRYEIEHPVINDADHKLWEGYGVNSWPTIIMIDPTGSAVWGRSGEFKAQEVREILEAAIPFYRSKKLLDETPLKIDLLITKQKDTPLRFPGKVLADEASGRLFIADSNHNRIVVATLDGKLEAVIGSGGQGRADGDFAKATFDHPQGMALHGNTLYIADNENHLLRKVDLETKRVSTIAGIGEQARNPWPGLEGAKRLPNRWIGKPLKTALASPWDVLVHEKDLYIAMAGPHQIWKMPLDESEIGPYAGNGREDIVDGPLLPKEPYAAGFSSFAQPSGLGTDGTWLYVADSEGSSVRAVPFNAKKEVRTVVGTADQPFNRLFRFGDKDGDRAEVLLQHCIGLTFANGQIYVADTYNNKIKVVHPDSGATKTLAGTGKPGSGNSPAEFDEPAGVSFAKGTLFVADTNNHQIRTIDIASGKVGTLVIQGLTPLAK